MPFRKILHARYVVPVVGEPIEDGFVSIEDGRIAEVGRSSPGGELLDLGNAAILPGLVNAHTHLEFSGLAQPLGTPGMPFVDWIREVIAWRRDHLLETQTALAVGMRDCTRHGVTTIGNISQWGEVGNAYSDSYADGVRFFEFISSRADFIQKLSDLALLQESAGRQINPSSNWALGLSPHAPYSVEFLSLKCLVDVAANAGMALSMHLAESHEELRLLMDGDGPFNDFLRERGLFNPEHFPGGKKSLDYLRLLSASPRSLIVHGNYLDDEEVAFLADKAEKMAAVYCPRTHAFFRHDRYPLEKMLAAGVTVALGTDSRASSPDLSVLAEMRFVARKYPEIDGQRILAFGTIDSARALGRANEIGSLEPGKFANLAVVALPDEAGDPYGLLLESDGQVTQTWFHGECVSTV